MNNNWSIQNEIKKQVNRESLYDWARRNDTVPIPQVNTKVEKLKLSAGVYNMVKGFVMDFRP